MDYEIYCSSKYFILLYYNLGINVNHTFNKINTIVCRKLTANLNTIPYNDKKSITIQISTHKLLH